MSAFGVTIVLQAKAGHEEKVKKLMMNSVQNEKGLLFAKCHQALYDPTTLMLYELWENKKAHQNHLQSEVFKKGLEEAHHFCISIKAHHWVDFE